MNPYCKARLGLPSVLLASLFLAGCKQPQSEKIVIRIDPPTWFEATGSGAAATVLYADGNIRERSIPYSDGSVGHQFYRPDKTLEKSVTYYPPASPDEQTAALKAEAAWSADGKVLVMGKVYRPDGSLFYTQEDSKEGSRTVKRFLKEGTLFSKTVTQKGSSLDAVTIYRADGSVLREEQWARVAPAMGRPPVPRCVVEKQFNKYGNLEWSAESTYSFDHSRGMHLMTASKDVTFYNAAAKPSHKQSWKVVYQPVYAHYGMMAFMQVGVQQIDILHTVETLTDSGKKDKVYECLDTGERVQVVQMTADNGKTHKYSYDAPRTTLLAKDWELRGKVTPRYLHAGPVEHYLEAGKQKSSPDGTVYDTIDHRKFVHPTRNVEMEATRKAVNSETVNLGTRDDSDPCKWYRRP